MNYITKANVGFKSEILGFGRVFDSLSPRDYDKSLAYSGPRDFQFSVSQSATKAFLHQGNKKDKRKKFGTELYANRLL